MDSLDVLVNELHDQAMLMLESPGDLLVRQAFRVHLAIELVELDGQLREPLPEGSAFGLLDLKRLFGVIAKILRQLGERFIEFIGLQFQLEDEICDFERGDNLICLGAVHFGFD